MTTPPSLACVLVTDTYATLRPMVARLLSQPGPHRLELIVVANRGGLAGIDAPELRSFDRVHGIELESTVQMHVARAVGVRAALSPLVFIGETHCFPCEGWLDATLKAFDGPCSILVPSVTNGCPRGLFGWAGYIMDYSRRRPEQPPEKFAGGIGYNAAYRTHLLLALGDRLDAALNHHEERLFADLQSQQPRILFEPAARLCHVGVTLFIPSLRERLFVGLILGDARARRWPIHRRILYSLAFPLIAAVLFTRELPGARHAISRGQTSVAVLPIVLLICLTKSIGEAWGYLFGCPEWAHSGEADIEIQRLRYARGFTQ